MQFSQASIFTLISFLVIVLFVLSSLVYALYKSQLNYIKYGLFVFVWILLTSIPVILGVIEEKPFPRLMIYFLASNFAAILLGISKIGKKIAQTIPIRFLILFQCFRLPLELILHNWAEEGVIPNTMTWTGQNIDIITGILAIVFYFIGNKYKKSALIFNGIGLGLLLNVMRVAVLSSPLPFSWKVMPPLQLGFHFPYSLIVNVCVAGALLGHILLSRAIRVQN